MDGSVINKMKTAILFSGTAYNFEYSISSLFENLIVPNDADVFILTSRSNSRRKKQLFKPGGSCGMVWNSRPPEQFRDDSTTVTDAGVELIKKTFGDRLKSLCFIEDMPEHLGTVSASRVKMLDTVRHYQQENSKMSLPMTLGGTLSGADDWNIKCVVDQYHHVRKCYDLMSDFELKNNFKYDYVMRVRLDFIAPERFDIQSYITQGDSNLYVCGSVRRDVYEWADEFCWFSHRDIAEKLFPNLGKMGTVVNRYYKTVENNGDQMFAAETQFSILLYELNIPVVNVKIYRTSRYTDGGDSYEYFNYMFRDDTKN